MAIAIDTNVVTNGNGVNSFAFPALTTAGQNEFLLAGFHFSTQNQTSITFDGSLTWTQLGTSINIPTAGGEIFVYYARCVQPLNAVAFTTTFVNAVFPQCSGIIVAYKGVDLVNPIGATNTGTTGSGTSVTAAITTTKANSQCIAFGGTTSNNALSAKAGQTEVVETASVGGFSRSHWVYENSITASSGTGVTMESDAAGTTSLGIWAIELLAGDNLRFKSNSLRPHMFSPGNAR